MWQGVLLANKDDCLQFYNEEAQELCRCIAIHIESMSKEDGHKILNQYSDFIIKHGSPKLIVNCGLNDNENVRDRFSTESMSEKSLARWFGYEHLDLFNFPEEDLRIAIETYLNFSANGGVDYQRIKRVIDCGIDPLKFKDVIGPAILKNGDTRLIAYGIKNGLVPKKKGRKVLVKNLSKWFSSEAIADDMIKYGGRSPRGLLWL